jgi:hypothetical protein
VQDVDRFRVIAASGGAQTSRLVTSDGAVIGTVDGLVLEAQYRCSRGYLVVTADGNPYEEALHFHLIDEGLKVIDQASLGRIYNSGTFSAVTLGAADQLEFSFFGSERWRLMILAEPQRVWPRSFASVRFPGGLLKRHLLRLEKIRA